MGKQADAMTIEARGDDRTVCFAAGELKRYLKKALPATSVVRQSKAKRERRHGFVVALWRDVSDLLRDAGNESPDTDRIAIRSVNGRTVLAGNNPRSVLFAVYDYLERIGFRWLHPGPDGETIPVLRQLPRRRWSVDETASFRYRGVCVEGAYTPRHAAAFIDWMAKKKMNHFYMQLEDGTFWYRRMKPDIKKAESRQWDRRIMDEVKKRGLLLEWYGHGWNHNAIGKHVVCLDKAYKVPDAIRPFLAEVDGKRKWHEDYPHHTQLCLTNPAVRAKVMAYVEEVIRGNPHVDILGLWLADGYNNQCECPGCREFRMSELYADYVNEIAERAHRIRPELKIEILAYLTTLEAPERVPVRNPHGNLILILAPLARCYRHRLQDSRCTLPTPIPAFPAINRLPQLGLGNANFARFFRDWRTAYEGDTYLFDYHLLALDCDFIGGNIPQMLSRDIKDLAKGAMNGYVGCQTLRCFWPSGLAMKVMADTLWNARTSYAAIRDAHMKEWFGEGAQMAAGALERMYRATSGIAPFHKRWPSKARLAESIETLRETADELTRYAGQRRNPLVRRRIGFLAAHAEYLADRLLVSGHLDPLEPDAEAEARDRLRRFFRRFAREAEFLLDAQYHGRSYLG